MPPVLVCFDVRLVPNKGRLLLVTPSRRRGEMQLHRSIRRHASAKTDILQMAPIGDCSPSVGSWVSLAGRDRKFQSYCQLRAGRPAN